MATLIFAEALAALFGVLFSIAAGHVLVAAVIGLLPGCGGGALVLLLRGRKVALLTTLCCYGSYVLGA